MRNSFASFWQTVQSNPVVVTQIAAAVIALAVTLGFAFPVTATASVMAVAQLIAAFVGRSQVSPVGQRPAPYVPEPAEPAPVEPAPVAVPVEPVPAAVVVPVAV